MNTKKEEYTSLLCKKATLKKLRDYAQETGQITYKLADKIVNEWLGKKGVK